MHVDVWPNEVFFRRESGVYFSPGSGFIYVLNWTGRPRYAMNRQPPGGKHLTRKVPGKASVSKCDWGIRGG